MINYKNIKSGPAFPSSIGGGLTKRELFAAMLLQGFLHNPFGANVTMGDKVKGAVEAADALLAELGYNNGKEVKDPSQGDVKPPDAQL